MLKSHNEIVQMDKGEAMRNVSMTCRDSGCCHQEQPSGGGEELLYSAAIWFKLLCHFSYKLRREHLEVSLDLLLTFCIYSHEIVEIFNCWLLQRSTFKGISICCMERWM